MRILLALLLMMPPFSMGKQLQPTPQRVKEIQLAVLQYGYDPGKTWKETKEVLRGIAREHNWQTTYAPDARVLILIGLGNRYSDVQVAMVGRNHLDGPQ